MGTNPCSSLRWRVTFEGVTARDNAAFLHFRRRGDLGPVGCVVVP
jgi:hypothetical protein